MKPSVSLPMSAQARDVWSDNDCGFLIQLVVHVWPLPVLNARGTPSNGSLLVFGSWDAATGGRAETGSRCVPRSRASVLRGKKNTDSSGQRTKTHLLKKKKDTLQWIKHGNGESPSYR